MTWSFPVEVRTQPPWLSHILEEKLASWIYLDLWSRSREEVCTPLGCSMFATRMARSGFIQRFYGPYQWKMYQVGKEKIHLE